MTLPIRDEKEEVIYFFKKLVFVLYLEIGALTPRIYSEIAAKAEITNTFFHGEKQRQSAELYHKTEQEVSPEVILAPYKLRTGLTLEDIHRAFVEGNWKDKHGAYRFGGPKLVKISEATLKLRDLVDQQAWDEAALLVYKIKKLKTNQGYLINQFDWTDRRRS